MKYYAHSAKNGIPAQPYAAHIRGVSARADRYAHETGVYARHDRDPLKSLTKKASVYHDLGKLNKDNQKVLSGELSSKKLPINHVDAGVAHFLRNEQFSSFSAAVIQAHHVGYPSFIAESNRGEDAFRDSNIASAVDKELAELETIHERLLQGDIYASDHENIIGDLSMFLRMLLSCVVDADHTNTAINYKKYPAEDEPIHLRAGERLAQLDSHIAEIVKTSANTKRNALRDEMYKSCRNADIQTAISSCDSPVGSGKTTAVMAHLLRQAEKRGLRRIFVVLPFTNIITQSVSKYREMLTLPGENASEVVGELHHRSDFESEEMRHLTALWRAPIIVTTAVAFFETLASNSTATLRRLHELPGSAIFVDESHAALPASLLPIAWRWMNVLAVDWSCYWVLASGSMCRFWTIPEIAKAAKKSVVPEIVEDAVRTDLLEYEQHRIEYRCDLRPKNTSELAEWFVAYPGPRLVIVNTVQSAAVLADYFSAKFGRTQVEHLSTALTPTDRENTLEHVKKRLEDKEDTGWTLIATSCVEAGINFWFKNGFRELASLSSLLQAAGRVNREGLYKDSAMITFRIADDGMLKLNPGLKQASNILKRYFEDGVEIKPELTTKSISDEIALYGLNGKHKNLIDYEVTQNFPEVESYFKVIDSNTCIAVIDEDIASRLKYGKVDWHELQKVSVQIAKYKLNQLHVPKIADGIYHWNLEYDNFLGYMAGVIKLKKYDGEVLIV